ncbi:unnamed protein product [Phytophthora fragariaefolia]|uniref:RxLR effector protein n=1 Tax=Phytophthora fragariaefolia TaxID=1490495 RepID=A0A9W6XCT2_9STRA|nr:unnamed protein product [Phytophthora fragariaefolia]
MRAYYIFAAVAVVLLASFDAASAETNSQISQGSINSVTTEERSLRIRKESDDNESEERGWPDAASANKLLRSTSTVCKVDDAAVDTAHTMSMFETIMGYRPKQPGKAEMQLLHDANTKSFKEMKANGWTPRSVAKEVNLSKRTLNMNKWGMMHSPDYLLWLEYSRWLRKNP